MKKYNKLISSQNIFYKNKKVFEHAMWNQAFLCIFPCRISEKKIVKALNNFVRTQEGIRVQVTEQDGNPTFYVEDFSEVEYEYKIFVSENELDEFVADVLRQPFHTDEKLYKIYIVEMGAKTGVVIAAHHILCDGGSIASLSEVIKSIFLGSGSKIYSLDDYEEKQTKYIGSKKYEEDKKFWAKQYSQYSGETIYEKDGDIVDYSSRQCSFKVQKQVARAIRKQCANRGLSVSDFFYAVLAHYFKEEKNTTSFSLGITLNNRKNSIQNKTFGLFLKLIPLFLDIKSDDFWENVQCISDKKMTAYRHADFSSDDISKLIAEEKNLYDIVVDYTTNNKIASSNLKIYYSEYLATPLEIHIIDNHKKDIDILIRYRTMYFSENNIDLMWQQMDKIIKENLGLQTLEGTRSESVLTGATVDIPKKNIYEIFYKNVSKHEDEICIEEENKKYTYREFFDDTQKIIRELTSSGIGKGDRIAVISERKESMYAALYGIIGAKASYVPVSYKDGKERIEYIIKDCKAKCVLVSKHVADEFAWVQDFNPLIIEDILDCKKIDEIIVPAGDENSEAYVIYTSGSTGEPKGAINNHNAVVNRIQWMDSKYGEDQKVILQKTTYTFDVSVWEIFWWGMYGGRMVILPDSVMQNISEIVSYIDKYKVTHVHFVPSVYRLFVKYLGEHTEMADKIKSLKHIILSGEALGKYEVEKMNKIHPLVRQHNLYGPTECAIDVSFYDCDNLDDQKSIPIGCPIQNVSLYIVGENDEIVFEGQKGELCIGGLAVGGGYVSKEGESPFKDNPFGNGRLYKTGDLCYMLDGKVYYCGRKDNQVKIHGQRVELGEIESALKTVANQECVVVYYERTLAAVYTDEKLDVEECTYRLKEKLPEYMIPTKYILVDEIPLLANGKVDRKKIEKIVSEEKDAYNIEEDDLYASELEQRICDIFSKQLGIKSFGRLQNFLEMGASSLDVMTVMCEDEFLDMTVERFCADARPVTLAKHIEDKVSTAVEMKDINMLYKAPNEKKVMILFPYAAGSVYSIYPLMNALKNNIDDMSFYYVGWQHNIANAAENIIELADSKDVYFYAHCAGSAIALQILQYFEKQNKMPKHMFVGGFVPPKINSKAKNPWKFFPDVILNRLLKQSGMPDFKDGKNRVKILLKTFRRDAKVCFRGYASIDKKCKCHATLFYNDKDIFTMNYKKGKQAFLQYVTEVEATHVFKGSSHYFHTDNCETIAELIRGKVEGDY